jgi:ComF family protein
MPTQGHAAEAGLCSQCEDHPPFFDHALAALDYAAPWQQLIGALKFRDDPAISKPLAQLLAQQALKRWAARPAPEGLPHRRNQPHRTNPLRLRAGAPTLLVPVPLSAQRLRERGYNQAALVAGHLSKALHLPMNPRLLVRKRDTSRMMSLDADARQWQIQGAFSVRPGMADQIEGRHVAIVDDVLTTGATVNEIARTLWTAGARQVSVWVLARTPAPTQRSALPPAPSHQAWAQTTWQDTQLME